MTTNGFHPRRWRHLPPPPPSPPSREHGKTWYDVHVVSRLRSDVVGLVALVAEAAFTDLNTGAQRKPPAPVTRHKYFKKKETKKDDRRVHIFVIATFFVYYCGIVINSTDL